MDEIITRGFLGHQLIACLLGKSSKVAQRTLVCGNHFQQLTALHGSQCFFGFQNRQRAIQAAGVEFLVDDHGAYSKFCAARSSQLMKRGSMPWVRNQSPMA